MHNAIIALLLAVMTVSPALGDDKPVTIEQVGKLLKTAGFQPQALSDDVWQVAIDRDDWKVHIMIALTRDGDRLWLESKFAPIADPEAVASSAWLKLLQENERISPAHFAFDKSDKRLHLYKGIENRQIDVARLKKEIDNFDLIVRRTQSIWRAENFTPIEAIPILPREK